MNRFVFLTLAAFATAPFVGGCCKACSAVKGFTKDLYGPNATTGEPLVKDYVVKDKALRKRICGVDTAELIDLVVKQLPAGTYSIEGTPIEKPAAPAKPDAGAATVEAKGFLVCTAVLHVMWHATEDNSTTTWAIKSVDVDEVKTPGAEFKRPPSADWD